MPHPPNRLNTLQAFQHQTKIFSIRVKDQDGRAVKLSGVEVIMTVKAALDSPVALITKKVGDGVEITDADNGEAKITLSTNDTGGLVPGVYRYDIWVEFPGEPVERQPVIRAASLEIGRGVTTFPVVG